MKLGAFDVSEQKGLFTFYCEGQHPQHYSYSSALAPNAKMINGIKKRVYSQMAEGLIPPSTLKKPQKSNKLSQKRRSQRTETFPDLPSKRAPSQLLKQGSSSPTNIVMMSLDAQERRKNTRLNQQSKRYHSCGGGADYSPKTKPNWTPLEQACMQIYSHNPVFLNQLDVMKVKQLLEPKKNFLMQLNRIKTKIKEGREANSEEHACNKADTIQEQIEKVQKDIRIKMPRLSLAAPSRSLKIKIPPVKVESNEGDLSPFHNQKIRKHTAHISNYPIQPQLSKKNTLVDKYHLVKFTKRLEAWKKTQTRSQRKTDEVQRLLVNKQPIEVMEYSSSERYLQEYDY